jgi:hypothetical protein
MAASAPGAGRRRALSRLLSFGKDGIGTSCEDAVTTEFADQICFVDGEFVRYPAGTRN